MDWEAYYRVVWQRMQRCFRVLSGGIQADYGSLIQLHSERCRPTPNIPYSARLLIASPAYVRPEEYGLELRIDYYAKPDPQVLRVLGELTRGDGVILAEMQECRIVPAAAQTMAMQLQHALQEIEEFILAQSATINRVIQQNYL